MYWFIKFGSPELELGKEIYEDVKIQLKTKTVTTSGREKGYTKEDTYNADAT